MTESRRHWLLRNGVAALLLLLLWDTVALQPFRVLVVLLHEIFHALAVLLTGGGVGTVEVLSHRIGMTAVMGGSPAVVYSAGYLGTALVGSLLLGSGYHYPLKRSLYLGLGALILAATLLFVRSPFGWAYGLAAGLLLVTLFFREFPFSAFLTDLLGLLCLVDVFWDLLDFALYPSRNDAAILAQSSGVPYGLILGTWAAFSLLMAAAAVAVTWRNLDPARQERRLARGEFRFVTKRFVERSLAMRPHTDNERKRSRITLAVYLSILTVLVLLTVWASRFVLFQPWTAREWTTAAATEDGRVYLFGGRDRHGQSYSEVYRLDFGRLRLRQITSLPSARFNMAAAAYDGKVYVLGGFDGRAVYDELLVLDPRRMDLRLVGRLPAPRTFGGAAQAGRFLYYLGGWDGERRCDEILKVDLATGGTELVGRLPSPREFLCAAVAGGRLYAFGGSDDRGAYLDEILEIDPKSGRVLRTGRLPSSRTRSTAVVMGERIFLIGGWEGRKVDEVVLVETGPAGIEARPFARLPRGVTDAAAVSQGERVFIVGGAHERFPRQIGVLRWDPRGGSVESVKFRSFLFW